MNPYRKGYVYEKKARADLEGMGYFVVESRGSRGPIDLVAIPRRQVADATDGLIRLIQVKYGTPIRKDERGRLRALAKQLESKRILVECWWYPAYQTKPVIEEA